MCVCINMHICMFIFMAKIVISKIKRKMANWEKDFKLILQMLNFLKVYRVPSISIRKHLWRSWPKREANRIPKYMERCSMLYIIIKVYEKYTEILFLTSLADYKLGTTLCWQDCGETWNFIHWWWEFKLVQLLWRPVWQCCDS